MCRLMLRCGLRGGDGSRFPWSAIALGPGTVRIDPSALTVLT